MNIFVLDRDYKKAAVYLCDMHVSKMLLETAQILCSPFEKGSAPYRRTHYNHPSSIWARESRKNYLWLINYGKQLEVEFEKRFNNKHKSFEVILWCEENIDLLSFEKEEQTEFPKVMPEQYICEDVVKSYRDYYLNEKKHFSKWRNGEPYWWK